MRWSREELASLVRSASTESLLSAGGDSRHLVGADGRNRYGNRYRPEPGLITLGSCTSSTVSAEAFAAAEQLHSWLAAVETDWLPGAIDDVYEQIRINVAAYLMPNVERAVVALTPSGTDAEYVPMLASLARYGRITNVVVGPGEAGSGSALAAAGRHFDQRAPSGRSVQPGSPVDERSSLRLETASIDIRDSRGEPRSIESIDAEVIDVVRSRVAAGHGVLLHVIAHSKTGVHAPSLSVVHDLVARHPRNVDVVIDAAQGRFSRSGLNDMLNRGYMVITSGSKFFGGPPFAGAVLIPRSHESSLASMEIPAPFADYLAPAMLPRSWRTSRSCLAEWHNVGLALRWWAALSEVRKYYSVPARLRFEVLRALQEEVPRRLGSSRRLVSATVPAPHEDGSPGRLLESNVTVFSFMCRAEGGGLLSHEELSSIRALVRDGTDGAWRRGHPGVPVEIGQPVAVGPDKSEPAYLRLAIGAREIVAASHKVGVGPSGIDLLLADIDQAVGSLDLACSSPSAVAT